MTIKLIDITKEMINAWKKEFAGYNNVEVVNKSIFDIEAEAIVSPANSFGIMDGGLDGKLRNYFGIGIEKKVKEKIEFEFKGELPVGNAISVKTGNVKFPYLISAPTMRVPEEVTNTLNSYLAMRAILIEGIKQNYKSIAIPGLGTISGKIPYNIAARQMRVAYDKIVNNKITYSHWREEKYLKEYMMCKTNVLPIDLNSV